MVPDERRIGVISDTHGLLRPAALDALAGCELIIHAGDVGKPEVLESLQSVAFVYAVRGNVDVGEWAESLPFTRVVEAGGRYFYVLHDVNRLDLDPAAGGFSVVISGHSHRASITQRGDVLFLNPGSAGPRRFSLPLSLALLYVSEGGVRAEIVQLEE